MAIRTHDELTNLINERITATDDATLELVGDLVDTISAYENRIVDADTRYAELDKSWRNKYRERFLAGGTPPKPDEDDGRTDAEKRAETITIDELFEERK